jgi:hypothetical protein
MVDIVAMKSLTLEVRKLGVKLTTHFKLVSAEVKNAWTYTSTPPINLHGVMIY